MQMYRSAPFMLKGWARSRNQYIVLEPDMLSSERNYTGYIWNADAVCRFANVKSSEESVKSCSGWLKISLDLSRLLGSVLREMKKPNILKIVEDYFSERRKLLSSFSGD